MVTSKGAVAIGLDFGTESIRALVVDLTGRERAAQVVKYRHGQIIHKLPTNEKTLPPLFGLQHPNDWIESSAKAVRQALRAAGAKADDVVGVGVDFTSCTMLPCKADGTPLCCVDQFAAEPYAWPKLWKHHGAQPETDRINKVAHDRNEPWIKRYGGIIGLEWFFPKILETLNHAPKVYHSTDVWIEGGDWLVWQLVGAEADDIPRSTCQAGYKAMWNRDGGYPSPDFFEAVHPGLKDVVTAKMPGRLGAPGTCAGTLCREMARMFGLNEGTPVSVAIIDAHAGVPGAGVAEAGTLVMVMGTSSCHMINGTRECVIKGIAGVVKDGILPGYYGYETGQAAVGDAFDWCRRITGERDFSVLNEQAAALAPGAEGVRALDWLNGCRTPLMDGDLRAAFTGLSLAHGPEHLYRALLEASAFGLRWIVELLEDGGVPVRKCVATGGLPHHNRALVQIYANVLGRSVEVHPSEQGPALGAAILGAVAAGKDRTGFRSVKEAVQKMAKAGDQSQAIRPIRATTKAYQGLYREYRELAAWSARNHAQ